MALEGPEDPNGFVASPIGGAKKRRRRGINYPLLVLAVALLGAAGTCSYLKLTPRTPSLALLQGEPSLRLARTCLWNHDYVCAEADYYAYANKYPKDPSGPALLALTLTQDGQHQEAIPYYRRAAALGVNTYDLDANYAISLNAIGDLDAAIKMNYAALQLAPSLVDVRGALADQLVKKGRAQEALNLLQTFDQTSEDEGGTGYFASQISQIRQKLHRGDQAAGVDQLATTDAHTVAPGTFEVPLQSRGGVLFAPVVVDDAITLNFTVDSGATEVCIPGDVARTLMKMGKLSGADFLGDGMAVLANGSRVPARIYRIHSMRIGDHEVRNVTASITNGGGSLLLGQSFLRRFRSWSIDNRRRMLVLQG